MSEFILRERDRDRLLGILDLLAHEADDEGHRAHAQNGLGIVQRLGARGRYQSGAWLLFLEEAMGRPEGRPDRVALVGALEGEDPITGDLRERLRAEVDGLEDLIVQRDLATDPLDPWRVTPVPGVWSAEAYFSGYQLVGTLYYLPAQTLRRASIRNASGDVLADLVIGGPITPGQRLRSYLEGRYEARVVSCVDCAREFGGGAVATMRPSPTGTLSAFELVVEGEL
jgi:hypothetical protein